MTVVAYAPGDMASWIVIMPYMMEAGEEQIVADALYAGLSKPERYEEPVLPADPPLEIQGKWAVTLKYTRGRGEAVVHAPARGASPQRSATRRTLHRRTRGHNLWESGRAAPARCL